MTKTAVTFRVTGFRCRGVVWTLLIAFCWSFLPAVSLAQQPTAALSEMSGTVLVNGQRPKAGMTLREGDVLETQVGASVVLTLSEGSVLWIGQNTKLDLAALTQLPKMGARTSSLKLWYGWLRAKLSAGHQQPGSSFVIETPNAQVGVKFSQPDVEVSYDPAKQETVGLARTVALVATNLLTNEKVVVPVGSTVIIVGTTIKIIAGLISLEETTKAKTPSTDAAGVKKTIPQTPEKTAATTGATSTGTTGTTTTAAGSTATATGMKTGTMIAIGAGALAAAGGIAAIASSSGDHSNSSNGSNSSFTGRFMQTETPIDDPSSTRTIIYDLTQNETLVTGSLSVIWAFSSGCTANVTVSVIGTVAGNTATLSWSGDQSNYCAISTTMSWGVTILAETGVQATLQDNGRVLHVPARWGGDFTRQ